MSDAPTPDLSDTPVGQANRWTAEFKAAREALEAWHNTAERCVEKYLDERPRDLFTSKLNLFSANVNTQEAMLYGNTPKTAVERRNLDADDDDARVAAQLLERHLNGDIARDEENFPQAIGWGLNDWLRVGFGNYRLRYVRETEPTEAVEAKLDDEGNELAPAIPAGEKLVSEDVETDYVYWKDQLWSPARVFKDVRWWAFRALLSQETAEKNFGERLELTIGGGSEKRDDAKEPKTPWARAEVWEIWDKEHKCVWWWTEGHAHVLVPVDLKDQANENGSIPDPLGLKNFWPFPEPLFSNLTTSKLVPRPDYALAQDLYESIDESTTRIDTLRRVVKAMGVYDKTVGELQEMLSGTASKLVPAENYAALAEKGGIANCITWFPLEAIVNALDKLRELRTEDMNLLYQVTGWSDIMRGQAAAAGATATEQSIKARFASVRVDTAQRRFARFASDGQRIRGEIICKHFAPETIASRANAQGLSKADQARVPAALQLLKSSTVDWRIVVKPEAISLTDYAANKQESLDTLGMVATYIQSLGQLALQVPQIAPMLLQILQVFLARVKGGDAIEGILDEAVRMAQVAAEQAQMQAGQPKQDPKLQAAQVKAQAEMGKAQASMQQTQLDGKVHMAKAAMDLKVAGAEHAMSMQKLEAQQRGDALQAVAHATGTPGGAT